MKLISIILGGLELSDELIIAACRASQPESGMGGEISLTIWAILRYWFNTEVDTKVDSS